MDGSFLTGQKSELKLENIIHNPVYQMVGTLSGPKCFLVYINDLETPVHLHNYVNDVVNSTRCLSIIVERLFIRLCMP